MWVLAVGAITTAVVVGPEGGYKSAALEPKNQEAAQGRSDERPVQQAEQRQAQHILLAVAADADDELTAI